MNIEMQAFDEATSETVGAVIADLRIKERDFKLTGEINDLGSLKDMQQLL
jgi:hypothetical protein